jgi:hypothetical protein
MNQEECGCVEAMITFGILIDKMVVAPSRESLVAVIHVFGIELHRGGNAGKQAAGTRDEHSAG